MCLENVTETQRRLNNAYKIVEKDTSAVGNILELFIKACRSHL